MTSEIAWAAPWVAAAAPLAGLVTAVVARRALSKRRPGPAWTAALARGVAVTLALLAAAGPEHVTTTTAPGFTAVAAAPRWVARIRADLVIPFDEDSAPTDIDRTTESAALALAIARASAPADTPTSLGLVWDAGDATPTIETADALRALRAPGARNANVRAFLLTPTAIDSDGSERDADQTLVDDAPPIRIQIPQQIAEGVPCRFFLDAGGARFGSGPTTDGEALTAELTIDTDTETLRIPAHAMRVATSLRTLTAGRHLAVLRVRGDGATSEAMSAAETSAQISARWFDVSPAPKVLVVSADGAFPPFARRLKAQGFEVDVASAATADLAPRADVIVLGPGTRLGAENAWSAAAESAAARGATGAGLLVMGGPGNGGLSRFRGTALAEVLPVTLPAPLPPALPPPPNEPRKDEPKEPPPDSPPTKPVIDDSDATRNALRVSLLLVLDRSGSMTATKMLMARESAIAAARALSSEDEVGVIAFNDDFEWTAPFQSVLDGATLRRRLLALRAGGGTNFLPALREGYRAIAARPSGIRHVVLVTDGQTRWAVFRDLVESGAAAGITLSTIAVGDDADENLLGLLATWGRGRLYPATDPEHLPQIMTQDARKFAVLPRDEKARALSDVPVPPDSVAPPPDPVAPRDLAQTPEAKPPKGNSPTGPLPLVLATPHAVGAATFLDGIRVDRFPAVPHVERVSLRGPAVAPLAWDDDRPALAVSRMGEGKVAVFTADLFSTDAETFFAWDDSSALIAQLIRSLAPVQTVAESRRVAVVRGGDGTAAVVVQSATAGTLSIRTTKGGTADIVVRCEMRGDAAVGMLPANAEGGRRKHAPGLLDGNAPIFAEWTPRALGEDAPAPEVVVLAPPPPARRDDRTRATQIAVRAGAEISPSLPLPPRTPPREQRKGAEVPLLAAAAALLAVEALARRGSRG